MENYKFESVPTPLASGGVGMYIHDNLKYTVLEKCSNTLFGLKLISQINQILFVE
jgi:hypothetical protein